MVSSSSLKQRLTIALSERRAKGLYVEVGRPKSSLVDFSSNDYLGFARADGPFLSFLNRSKLLTDTPQPTSSTGSRVLSGNSELIVQLETIAAKFHRAEASLLFNSGFDANLSLLSSLPGREDTIVYDQLVHASIHDGMRLSRARANTTLFSHNDVKSMREKVLAASAKHPGVIFVCVESVYSMEGDVAPLGELLNECKNLSFKLQREVYLIVDEAHSGGLFGENGEGIVVSMDLHDHPNLLARVITYGKSFAAHGAVVLCAQILVQFLVNYGRSFLFSTALPPHSVATMIEMYRFSKTEEAREARLTLWKRVALFQQLASKHLPANLLLKTNGQSAVQGFWVPDGNEGRRMNAALVAQGLGTYGICFPAVRRGEERIRIVIHAHNTEEQIRKLIMTAAKFVASREARL